MGASQRPRKARRKRFAYDVFLSHNTKDKPAIRDLAERLEQDGLRVWFDEWVIQPGDLVSLKIEQGLEQSRTLILVMSQNAFASEWVALERHTALFRDPTNTERRFIVLSVSITLDGRRAISGSSDQTVRVWNLPSIAEEAYQAGEATRYTNAKVLLVGDSGAGKLGLAYRLTTGRSPAVQETACRWPVRSWRADGQPGEHRAVSPPHTDEIGCISEERVLAGDLDYQDMQRLPLVEEEIILRAMHQTFVDYGLCLRERTDEGTLLVFRSYFRRERPELENYPAALVSYQFSGALCDHCCPGDSHRSPA